eukprot:592542-Amorphochlora_amoeboformis.AAC.1
MSNKSLRIQEREERETEREKQRERERKRERERVIHKINLKSNCSVSNWGGYAVALAIGAAGAIEGRNSNRMAM